MDYKVALLDLDGTLLNKAGNIPKKHLDILKKYSDLGGKIVVCTGRWPISAKFFNTKIEEYTGVKNEYMISLNGAIISDPNTDKDYFNQSIDQTVFKKLLLIREKFKVAMWIYSREGIASKIIHTFQIPFKKIISKFNYGKVISHEKFSVNKNVLKILFIHWNKKRIEKVYAWLNKYFSNYLTISKTSSNNLEITAHRISKGYALDRISRLFNIPRSQIAAFGDSGNDTSMFERAGLKVSIGDKNKYLMDIANAYVSKNEGGFYKAIDKFLLNDFPKFTNKEISISLKWTNLKKIVQQKYFTKKIYFWNYLIQQNKINLIADNPLWMNLGYLKNFLINRNTYILSGNFNSLFSVKTKSFIMGKTFLINDLKEIKQIISKFNELDNLVIVVESMNLLLPSIFYKNTLSLNLFAKDLNISVEELGSLSVYEKEKFLNNVKNMPLSISVWSTDAKIRKYYEMISERFKVSMQKNCLTFYPLENYQNEINNYLYSDKENDNLYNIAIENDEEYENTFNSIDEVLKKWF